MRFTISDEFGAIVLHDRAESEPPATISDSRTDLRALTNDGTVFLVDREDPIDNFAIDVTLDDLDEIHGYRLFSTSSGNYLLRVPTGELVVSGLKHWITPGDTVPHMTVDPGSYSVTVYSSDDFDSDELDKAMVTLVGEKRWRSQKRADNYYVVCFLATILAALLLAFLPIKVGALIAGLTMLLWIPYLRTRLSRPYKAAAASIQAFERGLPILILQLRRLDSTTGLSGGFYT